MEPLLCSYLLFFFSLFLSIFPTYPFPFPSWRLFTYSYSLVFILFICSSPLFLQCCYPHDRLCGLVFRVLGYKSGGPGSIPGTTRKKKVVGLERGPLCLMSTTEELLDRKVVAPI
jgi:hypothetical protein